MKGKTGKINKTAKHHVVKEQNKVLHIALWVAQVPVGMLFILAGLMKATLPMSYIGLSITWTNYFPHWFVRSVGVCELVGGLGILIPSIFRIQPVRTPIAATGLAILMLCAIVYHLIHKEYSDAGINAVLALAAAFIAWGRFKKVPITGK